MIDMLEIIYGTLFGNKEYEQFDLDKVDDGCINYRDECIQFDYDGKSFVLRIEED